MIFFNCIQRGLLLCLTGFYISTAYAEPSVQEVPLSRPNVFAYNLESDVLGLAMRVEVSLPLSYTPQNKDKKYPVMYLTDGFSHGLMIANNNIIQSLGAGETSPALIPEVITVAVDFLVPLELNSQMRLEYYTPTEAIDENYGLVGGKADLFIEFIRTELKPLINKYFNSDQKNETFAGHSLGGLFALYTLFTQPKVFDDYIIASPSNHWDNKVIHNFEQEYYEKYGEMDKDVYMSVGLDEDPNGVVFAYVKTMASTLDARKYEKLRFKMQAFEGENHLSVVVNAYAQGARHVFKVIK